MRTFITCVMCLVICIASSAFRWPWKDHNQAADDSPNSAAIHANEAAEREQPEVSQAGIAEEVNAHKAVGKGLSQQQKLYKNAAKYQPKIHKYNRSMNRYVIDGKQVRKLQKAQVSLYKKQVKANQKLISAKQGEWKQSKYKQFQDSNSPKNSDW